MLFYATPILYPIEQAPEQYQQVLMLNPLAVIFEQIRVWVIDPSAPNAAQAAGGYSELLPAIFLFGAVCVAGVLVFRTELHPESPRTSSLASIDEASAGDALPVPPSDLLQRIGLSGATELAPLYEQSGRADRKLIESLLPGDWDWHGKRVLDFGCGVGRVIGQFAAEAGEAEFWGCDLDRTSIEWARRNLEPPLHFFSPTKTPGLPQQDGCFDLIYAFSVYTHFTENWAGWLLKTTACSPRAGTSWRPSSGERMSEPLIGESWDESRIGMNPLLHDNP